MTDPSYINNRNNKDRQTFFQKEKRKKNAYKEATYTCIVKALRVGEALYTRSD
jgi:hypothetical protein